MKANRNLDSNFYVDRIERLEHSAANRDAIVSLRKLAFGDKFAGDIDLQGLEWNQTDSESIHFGIRDGAKIISTLRLTNISDPKKFENVMLVPATDAFAVVPCGVLARAATHPDFRGRDLGMALRMKAYEYWLANSTASHLFGTAFANSVRLEKLRSWGYEFATNEDGWSGYLKSNGRDVAVFRIAREKLVRLAGAK